MKKHSNFYNQKLLKMSLAFTKREHELHIEKLLKESKQLKKIIDNYIKWDFNSYSFKWNN